MIEMPTRTRHQSDETNSDSSSAYVGDDSICLRCGGLQQQRWLVYVAGWSWPDPAFVVPVLLPAALEVAWQVNLYARHSFELLENDRVTAAIFQQLGIATAQALAGGFQVL